MTVLQRLKWRRLNQPLTSPPNSTLILNQRLTRSGYSLTVKLTLSIMGLILVSIGSITWLSIRREQDAFKAELEEQATLLLDTLSAATVDWHASTDLDSLANLAEALGKDTPLLISGHVYNAAGQIIADTNPDNPLRYAEPQGQVTIEADGTVFDWQVNQLVAYRSVLYGSRRLGAVSIGLSTDPLKAKLTRVQQRGLIVAVITTLSGGVIATLISRSITRPLRSIMTATRRIAAGHFDERVEILSQDEFSVLAIAFNDMVEQLQQTLVKRQHVEQALRESEERYALAVQGANDGLWDWNLRTSDVYFSPRWKAILGYGEHEISNSLQSWFDRVHAEDVDPLKSAIADHLQNHTPHVQVEYRMQHRNGHYCWILSRGVAIRDDEGTPYRMSGSQTDITIRKEAEFRMVYEAMHDTLTGLPNRTFLLKRIDSVLQRSHIDLEFKFAVLFLDFDRFKIVNDSLGHKIGDTLLIGIAQRLEKCLRSNDLVARLGGDEFVLLLEGIHQLQDATDVADRIQQQMSTPFKLNGHDLITTASIGIVMGGHTYQSADEILRDADISMYQAKERGKAQYAVFHPSMHEGMLNRLNAENDLRDALVRREFKLHYQPIINLKTGAIIGFESLLRWHHRKRGALSPNEFISLAEETGLIIPIGEWAIAEACRHAHQWTIERPDSPPFTVSVNLSSNQIAQPDLIPRIVGILTQTRLPATQLRIEITESVIMENLDAACCKLEALRHLGIKVYIDDFGTGYSSLGYLQTLPVDALKIDQTFVRRIGLDKGSEEIVRTVVMLAKGLGMDVIAEGVETSEQQCWLQLLECDYAQGFLFSTPLDADSVGLLLQHHPQREHIAMHSE